MWTNTENWRLEWAGVVVKDINEPKELLMPTLMRMVNEPLKIQNIQL